MASVEKAAADEEPETPAERSASPGCNIAGNELLAQTIDAFKSKPSVPKLHDVAQRKYNIFCRNRSAELYTTFFALVGVPDFSDARFSSSFMACVPFPGKTNERLVCGMAKDGVVHGLARYEYKGNLIEEGRKDGLEHGLRVVFTQMGDTWIRLNANGKRLAQIVLSADYRISANPKPVDDGGLKQLRSHLHLVLQCFEAS